MQLVRKRFSSGCVGYAPYGCISLRGIGGARLLAGTCGRRQDWSCYDKLNGKSRPGSASKPPENSRLLCLDLRSCLLHLCLLELFLLHPCLLERWFTFTCFTFGGVVLRSTRSPEVCHKKSATPPSWREIQPAAYDIYSSIGAHVQIKFRSPYASSTRLTDGQIL